MSMSVPTNYVIFAFIAGGLLFSVSPNFVLASEDNMAVEPLQQQMPPQEQPQQPTPPQPTLPQQSQPPASANMTAQDTVGVVQWLESAYSSDATATIRVADFDMNMDPQTRETIQVVVYSETDPAGVDLRATETGNSTGVFEGEVSFTESGTSGGTVLLVSGGDIITASYEDQTTDSGVVDVTATTKIIFEYNPPYAQVDEGIPADKVSCMDENNEVVLKDDSTPICVSEETHEKLVERGYFDSKDTSDAPETIAEPEPPAQEPGVEEPPTQPSEDSSGNPVIAEVNDSEIRLEKLEGVQATMRAQAGQEVDAMTLVDQLITNELLLQEANSRDISVSRDEARSALEQQITQGGMTVEDYDEILQDQGTTFDETVSFYQEQFTIDQLVDDVVSSGDFAVSESEIEEFFDDNIDAIKGQFGEDVTYEDVSDIIESTIMQQKQQSVMTELIDQLRNDAEITIYEDRI